MSGPHTEIARFCIRIAHTDALESVGRNQSAKPHRQERLRYFRVFPPNLLPSAGSLLRLADDADVGLRRFSASGILFLRLVIRNTAADDDVLAGFPIHRR